MNNAYKRHYVSNRQTKQTKPTRRIKSSTQEPCPNNAPHKAASRMPPRPDTRRRRQPPPPLPRRMLRQLTQPALTLLQPRCHLLVPRTATKRILVSRSIKASLDKVNTER